MRCVFVCQNKCTGSWITVWLCQTMSHRLSRTCSLPWRKRRQVWPWWQRQLGRGGWCWNGKLIGDTMGDKMIKKSYTYSPVITTSGDWTQILAILSFFNFSNFYLWPRRLYTAKLYDCHSAKIFHSQLRLTCRYFLLDLIVSSSQDSSISTDNFTRTAENK